jgi:putative CocE/NonD family hydrolase
MEQMSVGSRLLARLVGLPRARTYQVAVERDLRVPMRDGVELLADRYFAHGDERAPIVLLRSPYGRRTLFVLIGRLFAERGYQAVIQSVRGTFGSGGAFAPMHHEAEDGRATLEWLAAQPWFGGRVGLTGPSYLGYVQWAVAADAPDYVRALAPQITASQFRSLTYPGESFALKTPLSWLYQLHYQELPARQVIRASRRQERALAPAFAHVPLNEADTIAVGQPVTFYQHWLVHNVPGDPYWEAIDHSQRVDAVAAPVNLVAGWYDIFLPEQLEDYAALRRAGRQPHLTIGPWSHMSLGILAAALKETLAWFDGHLRGELARLRSSPVRIFVLGTKRWRDLPDWPPPAASVRWYLQPEGRLAPAIAAESSPDRYRYDPADPTPSVGGTVLTRDAGPRDNRHLEARADVLTYTSAPLEADLEVIGPVAVEIYVESSLEHTDFFARLCDVEPGGRSINICDGLVRLQPGRIAPAADGTMRVCVDLWPTACCFRQGHRLRVQVSSGAHPRYARNLGSGEPLGTATTCVVAEQCVWHDAAHPSAVVLPVVGHLG